MKHIINGEPYIYQHKCQSSENGKSMNEQEKRELLIDMLLTIYHRCNMHATKYEAPKKSFFQRLFGASSGIVYPDICIDDFKGTKGAKAYYYVRPQGNQFVVDTNNLPQEIQNSWVKVITGSVFCLERQQPDLYIKGASYASQFFSQAVLPKQTNQPLTAFKSDKELAEVFVSAWQQLDHTLLYDVLDKDFHYSCDAIFDDMSSRDEYLDYLQGKFNTLRRTQSVKRVQLGRNGETGDWSVLIKQIQTDGSQIVVGIFLKSANHRLVSASMYEMDIPDF